MWTQCRSVVVLGFGVVVATYSLLSFSPSFLARPAVHQSFGRSLEYRHPILAKCCRRPPPSRSKGYTGKHFDVIPIVTLDQILPVWASSIHFLKIDTQGNELKILNGARESLAKRRFRYVLYELSPWLMEREATGDPLELLHLMPDSGALCFDMLKGDTHNTLPHPERPLKAYLDHLITGEHSFLYKQHKKLGMRDPVGPWDDILCTWLDEANSTSEFARDWRCPAALHALQAEGFKEHQHGGVSSLLREHNCGHENMATPSGVMGNGTGKVIVDVGLGLDAGETHTAVGNGYTVFAFEFLPSNIRKIKERRQGDSRYRFVELEKAGRQNGTQKFLLPELPHPPSGGFAYIIHAGLSDGEGSVRVSKSIAASVGTSLAVR